MDRSALPLGQAPVYFYEIDENDRIIAASDTWDAFALENEGEHLVIDKVRGDLIWDHIKDEETVDLYRRIFGAARRGRPVQFFLRCDSPEVRRMLSVNVARSDSGKDLRISTMLFRADKRQRLTLRGQEGSSVPVCSWCEKVLLPEHGWQELEEAVGPLEQENSADTCQLSYTVCPDCRRQIERQLEFAY
jgi:hypothetical protein